MTCCFDSPEKCEKKFIQSNPRYRNFCQTFFTAGDEEQFIENLPKKDLKAHFQDGTARDDTANLFTVPQLWDKYSDLSGDYVIKTFRYISNKFKKGVFVAFNKNSMSFLPFSKAKFSNDWNAQIAVKPEFKNVVEFIKYAYTIDNRPFREDRVNKYTSQWYANNCLLRFEYPMSEGDTGVHHLYCMMDELSQSKTLPDVEFFVNRRDFPILKRNGTEPYDHLWDTDNKPLTSHLYDKYVPILSSVTTDQFADIPIPTCDDWARVKFLEGKYLPKTHKRDYSIPNVPWEDKKPIAVFRGASTGAGVTTASNMRLKIAHLSKQGKIDTDGLPFLDAGITEWNVRIRKVRGERYLQVIEPAKLPFGLVGRLTPLEQASHKYIVNIDGHVAAFRLSLELALGSVILKVQSPYRLWYSHLLEPYKHYVPVKSDLSDLYTQIKWCKENDEKCRQIALNARKFYDDYLSKKAMLEYLYALMVKIKDITGSYTYPVDPLTTQTSLQMKWLNIEREKQLVFSKTYTDYYYANEALRISGGYYEKLQYMEDITRTAVSKIEKYKYKGVVDVAVKSSISIQRKTSENIHEAYIGLNCINPIVREIPNFLYTFDYVDEKLVSQYIEGVSFMKWIESPLFSFQGYLNILAQISLSLHISQKRTGFVHNDLFPWNIMIRKGSDESLSYIVNHNTVINIQNPDFLPVIIDYGKSHVIHNNKHYGIVNRYKFNMTLDIVFIIFSSIFLIIKNKKLHPRYDSDLLYIANFNPIRKFRNFGEMRQYLYDNCNFSNMTSLYIKSELSPYDFFNYISKYISYSKTSIMTNAKKLNTPSYYFGKKVVISQRITNNMQSDIINIYSILYLRNFLDTQCDITDVSLGENFKAIEIPETSNIDIEDFEYMNPVKNIKISKYNSKINQFRTILEKTLTMENGLQPDEKRKVRELYMGLIHTHFI